MKNNNLELNKLNVLELKERLDQLKRAQFGLRLNLLTSHVKDFSQFKKIRREIARIHTFIKQKEQTH